MDGSNQKLTDEKIMNAIYKGKLYQLGDDLNQCRLLSDDIDENGQCHGQEEITVSYGDPELIIDPTDDEINNILPDYFEDKGLVKLPPIDQIVGCNVHGRLTYIRDLVQHSPEHFNTKAAISEINKLLEFFPNPVDKP